MSDHDPAEEATTVDRTAAERLATAAERASVGSSLERHPGQATARDNEADDGALETPEAADKTDMSAVGDDGQVFGG